MSIQYGLVKKSEMQPFLPLIPESEIISNADNVYAIGAVNDNEACGILVFNADDIIATIQYIAVSPKHRGKGIANGMIDFLCKYAYRDTIAVVVTFAAKDRDEPICQLLTKRGDFTINEDEDYVCRIPTGELAGIKIPAELPRDTVISSFYELSEEQQTAFFLDLKKENEDFAMGIQEEKEFMLKPLCFCAVTNGKVGAAIFCQKQDNDVLLSFAYGVPNHARSLMTLIARLRDVLSAAADKVPYLRIAVVNPESRKLVETLYPNREVTQHFYIASWDMNTVGGL